VKSDVWRSVDGRDWELVSAGCHAPQENLVASGNTRDGKHGLYSMACKTSEDCYGSELCHPTYVSSWRASYSRL
jgi:hypothetical protein